MGDLHTIGKREEGITGHHRSLEIELEVPGFLDGLVECIHSRCLSRTTGDELLVFCQDNGVGLGMLHQYVGKEQVFSLDAVGALSVTT